MKKDSSSLPENDDPVIEGRHPIPIGGNRFRLTHRMHDFLKSHPIAGDLILLSSGEDCRTRERRKFKFEKLPGYLIAYCTGGSGELKLRGESYQVKSGDLIALEESEMTYLVPDRGDGWTFFFIIFSGALARSYFENLKLTSPVVKIGLFPRLVEEMAAFVDMKNAPMRLDLFVECCCRLKYFLSSLAIVISDSALGEIKNKIDYSMILMQRNLSQSLRLEELSNSCGLSVSYFVRQFKERNGQSPMHYYLYLKIQHACTLLETTSSEVKEIGKCIGYEDPYNFSRAFKRVMGVSPLNYRKRLSMSPENI